MGQTDEVVARNRRQQTEWYGEPLGERVRRLIDKLDVSQTAFADILGLSAPMLSQLMSGHRAKISNPAVLSRLMAVEALVTGPEFDLLPAREVRDRLDAIRQDAMATPSTTRIPVAPPQPQAPSDPVLVIQALLRSAASATEIESAAALLDADFPELATILRTYGNGRTAEARQHLTRSLSGG